MIFYYIGGFTLLFGGAALWINHLYGRIAHLTRVTEDINTALTNCEAANQKIIKQLKDFDEIESNRPTDAAAARRRMLDLDKPGN